MHDVGTPREQTGPQLAQPVEVLDGLGGLAQAVRPRRPVGAPVEDRFDHVAHGGGRVAMHRLRGVQRHPVPTCRDRMRQLVVVGA